MTYVALAAGLSPNIALQRKKRLRLEICSVAWAAQPASQFVIDHNFGKGSA